MNKNLIYALLAIGAIVAIYFLFIQKRFTNKALAPEGEEGTTGVIYPTISTDGWDGDVLRHEGNRFTPENGKWVLIGKA